MLNVNKLCGEAASLFVSHLVLEKYNEDAYIYNPEQGWDELKPKYQKLFDQTYDTLMDYCDELGLNEVDEDDIFGEEEHIEEDLDDDVD